jgi:acyl carrier protein
MGPVQSTEEIFESLRGVLHELFEIDPAQVTLDAHLYNDLEIDSIDTIDLILRLKELTGRKIQPDQFRHVRTVGDAVNAIQAMMLQHKPAAA